MLQFFVVVSVIGVRALVIRETRTVAEQIKKVFMVIVKIYYTKVCATYTMPLVMHFSTIHQYLTAILLTLHLLASLAKHLEIKLVYVLMVLI